MRLSCPGARTGAFFVHAVPNPPSRRRKTPRWLLEPGPEAVLEQGVGVPDASPNLSPLSLLQPSRADFFDCLFVTHFIESFGNLKECVPVPAAPSPTWLDELPALVSSPELSLAKCSIRAGSMLLYGTRARDVSIQTEARRWYARALRRLRCGLLPSTTGTKDSALGPFNGDGICAAVMLSHFETVAGTSLGAWAKHVDGASAMLESLGPELCCAGFTHRLFRHLRLLTVRILTRMHNPDFALIY